MNYTIQDEVSTALSTARILVALPGVIFLIILFIDKYQRGLNPLEDHSAELSPTWKRLSLFSMVGFFIWSVAVWFYVDDITAFLTRHLAWM